MMRRNRERTLCSAGLHRLQARIGRAAKLQMRLATLLVLVAMVAVLFAVYNRYLRPGVYVELRNSTGKTLTSVTVHVTGRSYDLGDLNPGETNEIRVEPTSESDVDIEFVDAAGLRQGLKAECYIEPGYRGSIRIDVRNAEEGTDFTLSVRDDIELY